MIWDIIRTDGTVVHRDDTGQQHTLTADGVARDIDPHYSSADTAALAAGDIDIVEYRRRYYERYHS